jgi:hypothetical protein
VTIVKAEVRGSRCGRLVGLRPNRVTAVLGFVPNADGEPVTVGREWQFEADGEAGAIWRFRDSPHLSYFGPESLFARLFGREHVVPDPRSEVPF